MASAVETPSGKTHHDENFPVGSWLLPARLRPHVAAFYAFARAADDIGDNPALTPADKLARLDAFGQALSTGNGDPETLAKPHRLRRALAETGVTPRHGLDLLEAFKQDAVKPRYADWAELEAYCLLSAAPVGRFLLDLHGEDPALYPASDGLCNALQVLNHLQDCQADHRSMDRVYLPLDWLAANGATVEDLQRPAATPGLRAVIDLCLDGTARWLAAARPLPGGLRCRRLAMETAVIVRLADRLWKLLRRNDPIAGRVALTKGDFLRCGLSGVVAGAFGGAARFGLPVRQGARP